MRRVQGGGKSMAAELGTDIISRLEGMRADLCRRRDSDNSLIREIDKVLATGPRPLPITRPKSETRARIRLPKPTEHQGRKSREGIIQFALKRLAEEPYRTPELLKVLAEDGHPVKGKRPIQTLYGILHKDLKSGNPRVERTKAGFWRISKTN